MGSYVEVYLIDRRRPDHADMLATSWKYLRIAWVHEPIGPHYLRRLLVSLKFELNMFVAVMGLIRFSGRLTWVDRSSWSFLLSLKQTTGVEPVGNRVLCGFP